PPPFGRAAQTRWLSAAADNQAGSRMTTWAGRARSSSRTDRDDVPLGLHDPRAEARRTEAVLDRSAVGVVHDAAGQRDAVSRTVARDKPGDVGGHPRDNGRRGGG